MAANNILPFAQGAGAAVLSQAAYAAIADRLNGNQPGMASQALVNKAFLQVSAIAAGVAQFMANRQAADVTDALDANTIATMLTAALVAGDGVQLVNASTVLTLTSTRKLVQFSGATAAQILTLPAIAGLQPGATILFQNVASVPVTIKGNAAETIQSILMGVGAAAAANTITLGVGDSVRLVFTGASWIEQASVKAANLSALGCGNQTLQNLTASRALSTTFTNSTGRAIWILVRLATTTSTPSGIAISVGAVSMSGTDVSAPGVGVHSMALVPAGATYRAQSTGGASTLDSWFELR